MLRTAARRQATLATNTIAEQGLSGLIGPEAFLALELPRRPKPPKPGLQRKRYSWELSTPSTEQ